MKCQHSTAVCVVKPLVYIYHIAGNIDGIYCITLI